MIAIVLILAVDFGRVWHDLTSYLANSRGVKQFAAKQYAKSTQSFDRANAIRSTPAREFNLGTAEVAAGDGERGAAALDKAMRDPRLRADALYNRGTSALAAKAYDSAIRDYVEALKLRPTDAAAKHNLEIARVLKLAQQQQQESSKGRSGPQPQSQKQQPRASGEQPQEKGEADADAMLRAVQQQEKEELARMHRARGEKLRVGW
ncbi:MAG TPA: tetratricopeptide repeat protein [Thermoanaerobaculia bacterium]|nr:tetratricopeptide repeat protein [Thermoanaerobaculia bacterium]